MNIHHLTDDELRQVQLIQLEMLKEVDRICVLCGIRYNIIAGTLLGAVRHQGYIPWDDDADVALLRDEYEKFRIACGKELDHSRFYFQDHRNTPGYRWGYGKLRRKGTLFLRENQEHMPYDQGIFIDIFPLDGVSNNKLLRTFQNFHCYCIRKMMWAPVGRIVSKGWFLKRWYRILEAVPADALYGYYDRYVRRRNKKVTKWVRILTFPTPNKEYGYLREWYENSEKILFENETFCGIRDYDAYLTFKFGEYMKLPPMEMRKVHPVTALQCLNEERVEEHSRKESKE